MNTEECTNPKCTDEHTCATPTQIKKHHFQDPRKPLSFSPFVPVTTFLTSQKKQKFCLFVNFI